MFSKKGQKKLIALLEKHLKTIDARLARLASTKETVKRDINTTTTDTSDNGPKMLEMLYRIEMKLKKLEKRDG